MCGLLHTHGKQVRLPRLLENFNDNLTKRSPKLVISKLVGVTYLS